MGSGLDFKIGVFDSIIGYESIEAGNNPNFTRSYGHSIEPQTETGLLASYRFCDLFQRFGRRSRYLRADHQCSGVRAGQSSGARRCASHIRLTWVHWP